MAKKLRPLMVTPELHDLVRVACTLSQEPAWSYLDRCFTPIMRAHIRENAQILAEVGLLLPEHRRKLTLKQPQKERTIALKK